MRKPALVFISACVLLSITVMAQDVLLPKPKPSDPAGLKIVEEAQSVPFTPFNIGSETTIQELRSANMGDLKPGIEACGKYFRYIPHPSGDRNRTGQLFFVSKPETKDLNQGYIFVLEPDELQVRRNNALKVPKMKVLRSGGPIYPWYEVSISEKEMNEAPCLTHVKTVG